MIIDFKELDFNKLKPENDFEKKVVDFIKEWFSASETVSVQTSGSTGIPKILEVEKSKMLNSAVSTCNFLDLKENETALICLPVEYISGKMMVVRSVVRNLKLKVSNPSINPLIDLHEHVDFCAMTPLQVENSLDKLHLIKKIIIGGAAVSESLKQKIYEKLNSTETKIYETYGMSETLSHIALKEIFPKEEEYFTAFENIEISQDERGRLKIFAPQLNPEVLQTNDIVELINDRQFKFLGRADNIINSGGAKIFPEELEKIVKRHISNEAVFIGIPDETLGQKLILAIEGKEDEKINSMISKLQFEKSFHKPKGIIFVDEIPRTPNGKVNRRELLKILK